MMLSSYVPGFGIWRLPAENIEKNYLGTTLIIIPDSQIDRRKMPGNYYIIMEIFYKTD